MVEKDKVTVRRMLLESIEATDSRAGVATQHERKSVVSERLLDSQFKLLVAPHDSELVMRAVIRLQKRLYIEQLHVNVPLAL